MNFRALSSASLVLLLGVAPLAGCGSSTSSTSADSGTHADAGGDVTTHGGGSCTTNDDCMKKLPATTPANCATATCNALEGTCAFAAKDQDGDGHNAANCKASGVTIVAGDDCNDDDANLYPGHAEACTKGEDGGTPAGLLCKQGALTCLSDGSVSPCTGSVYCVNQTCSNGTCEGACTAGQTTCSANAVLTCAGGAWGAPSPCTHKTCVGGEVDGGPGPGVGDAGAAMCTGMCAPGDTQCDAQQPQTCGADGAWVNAGAACAMPMTCQAGACVTECQIAGAVYTSGAANPNNACQTCQPAVSTSAWSNVPDGTSCGNAQVCGMGLCGSQCEIADAGLVGVGAPNPENPCQSCQPGMSTTSWTDSTSGTSCGTGSVCNSSGMCLAGCIVDGTFYPSGALDPSNSCAQCDPATSTTAFSTLPEGTDCTAPGAAAFCHASVCSEGCFIAGSFYAPLAPNPASGAVCQVCQTKISATEWSLPSGSPPTCGAGGAGTCTAVGVCTMSFSTTGVQTFVVPAGVTQVTVTAIGASGAGPCPASMLAGGGGGQVMATITVTPGSTLYLNVGAQGACTGTAGPAPAAFNGGGTGGGGYNQGAGSPNVNYGGGGGGGASDVRTQAASLASRVVVAGGGGGIGGVYTTFGAANAGGEGGGTTTTGAGAGGTLGGGAGTSGGAGGVTPAGGNGTGGAAGVAGIGGGAGKSSSGNGGSGGGGGGGGYFGGGGGAGGNGLTLGGGGGGGSSYADPTATNVTMTADVQAGNGSITISY